MERLTKRYKGGIAYAEERDVECGSYCDNCGKADCETVRNMIRKLADYEDAEEQGLLLKLSCKVGDRVYTCFKNHCNEIRVAEIKRIELGKFSFGNVRYLVEPIGRRGSLFRYYENDFGKTVFLTREAAEQALKEMEDEDDRI